MGDYKAHVRPGERAISATPADFRAMGRAAARFASKARGPVVVGVKMGDVLAIEYARGNKTYRHEFRRRPVLARTRDGKTLVVSPVRAATWIEDATP